MIAPATPPVRAEDYVNLARSIASRFLQPGEELDDSEQFGDAMLGLAKAMRKYNRFSGHMFSTFATRVIHNTVISGLRKRRRSVPTVSLDESHDPMSPETVEGESLDRLVERARQLAGNSIRHMEILVFYATCPSWSKVAKRFGIPKSTAQFRGTAVKNMLKDLVLSGKAG